MIPGKLTPEYFERKEREAYHKYLYWQQETREAYKQARPLDYLLDQLVERKTNPK